VPVLSVVAGPNGSGKSTLTLRFKPEGLERLLNPDVIARELNPTDPSAASIEAGRATLLRAEAYLAEGLSFAIETTLSGHGTTNLITRAKSRAYLIDLIFVALDTPDRCISRIRNRVALGGHHIPDDIVRRRHSRSIANAWRALEQADATRFFDNSGDAPQLVLMAKAGIVVWQADPFPEWLRC
jgi:predicted ABC-type ATPase